MAIINIKANLVENSNLFLHIADKGGTDISLDFVSGIEWTLTSPTQATWATTEAADANGVINKALIIGDTFTLSHTANTVNEQITGEVTAVTGTVVTFNLLTGTPINEVAGSDMNIVAFKKTYEFVEAGGLSFIDGVLGLVLTAKLVDMWDLIDFDKYLKPFSSIEPRAKSLASLNGWEPHNVDTLKGIRDTALEIRDTGTSTARKIYVLFKSNDLHAPADQITVWPSSDPELTAPELAVMTGSINQLFLIFDVDGADNRFSNGVTWFTRCMEPFKTPVMEQHEVNYAEIVPVSAANTIDPKLVAVDATINAGGDYANVTFNSDVDGVYDGDVNSVIYNFDGYIEGDNQTNQTVHEKIHWLWRQPININSDGTGAIFRGDKQFPISSFSGEVFTLESYLLNFNAAQRNDLRLIDNLEVTQSWPSILTVSILSASLAHGGTFTIWHKNSYGTSAAIIFQNEAGTPQQDITIAALVNIVMAYSTYNVDSHTPNTPLPIVISYNHPAFIEPDVVELTLAGTNVSATLSLTPNPSYI